MRAPYRLRRKKREDELDEEEEAAQPAVAPTTPAPAARPLDLQRTAGNRAVGTSPPPAP
jgi:hypothetical protein